MNVMRSPRKVDLMITTKCNLRCRYCAHFTSESDVSDDLPTDEWLKFFEELRHNAVPEVTLQGGEPFCREDFEYIILGIVKNNMRFCLLTNGTLITEELARFLASTKRCNYVQVSVDGADAFTHDSMRGEGNFNRAVSAIEILKRRRINYTVRVTIHRQNVRKLYEVARFLLEDLKLRSFGTNSANYMGLCRTNKEAVQLDADEQFLAMETLLKLDKIYKGRIQASAGPLAEARMWLKMKKARRENEPIPARGVLASCGGVYSSMGVRADGIMIPCCQLSHIELGRINKDKLADVWQRHPEIIKLRKRRTVPLRSFELCRDCIYTDLCAGGCPATAYTIAGDANCPNPESCLKLYLEKGGKLPSEELIAP